MASFDKLFQSVREDDFVEYFLFPPIESTNENEQNKLLSSMLAKANKIIDKVTSDFLWHKDAFKLSIRTSIYNELNNVSDDNGKSFIPILYPFKLEWLLVNVLFSVIIQSKN